MKLSFVKMHGIGNDFIFFDGMRARIPTAKKLVKKWCHRRYGIGADQILILTKSRKADFKMRIINADGNEVEMCGNGLRCLAKYVKDEKLSTKKEISVETGRGVQKVKSLGRNRFAVDMGEPVLRGREIPVNLSGRVINRPIRFDGRELRITCVGLGNPHAVVFQEDLSSLPIEKLGPQLETHSLFPKKVNVEFVRILSYEQIEMRVWERGVGETLACGSGASAAAVASVLNGFTDRKVHVKLRGGMLQVEWSKETGHVILSGPAERVFTGELEV